MDPSTSLQGPGSIRNRWHCLLGTAFVLLAGLAWRSHWLPLPHFLHKYGGDTLWSVMVYLGLAFLLHRQPVFRIALAALAFSWAVEFSQLYHTPWLDSLRSLRLGRLILGSTFNWPDFIAYAVGVGIGAMANCLFLLRKT